MGIGRIETVQTEFTTVGWGNGLMKARPLVDNGKKAAPFNGFIGFFTEVGRDHALDDAMTQAGIEKIEAQHPRENGDPIIKNHWNLGEELRFYPITQGPPAATLRLCLAPRTQPRVVASGIGLRWPEGGDSQIGIIGYLEPLIKVGYIEPVKLATRSLMVDYFLKALADHHRVAKFADSIVDRQKHPDVVELYELAWIIGAGEQVSFGKTKTSLVSPMISMHPHDLTKEYIRDIYLRDDETGQAVREKALQDWETIKDWAATFAQGTGDQFTDEPHDKEGNTGSGGSANGSEELTGTVLSTEPGEKSFKLQLGVGSTTHACIAFKDTHRQLMGTALPNGTTLTVRGRHDSDPQWGKRFIITSFTLGDAAVETEDTEEIPF